MSALLAALGIGIVSYIAIIFLFPKSVPQDGGDLTRQALDRIYEENANIEDNHSSILRGNLLESEPLIRMIFGSSLMRPLYEAAIEAGFQRSLKKLLGWMIGIFIVATYVAYDRGLGLNSFFIGLILAYFLPYKYCKRRVKKRNDKFINQFPDALDIIVRSVRSGFPLSVALQMLAENTEDPVREEFRQVVDDIALGRPLQQALARLAVRINESDIRFFVVVLSVQQETGGNLAEIIGNLSNVIRKRKQLRHKIHAITSEGRATGWVLGSMPILLLFALSIFSHDYVSVLWMEPAGHKLLGAIAGLIAVCAIVIKQMITVDI